MASRLAENHILLQESLRKRVERAAGLTWTSLGKYNEADVDVFLARVVPLVQAGQAQAALLTDAYLARALERQPLGIDTAEVIANARNGVTAEEVYRRPFVDVWGGLKGGKPWNEAVALGLERATSAAAMDMQLAMRTAARDIGVADEGIYGYERVPDGGACDFCLIASTQRYSTEDLMPLHNRCVTGDTLVSSPSGLGSKFADLGSAHATTRRWYEGQIVCIYTAAGDKLTVTPNHPVLTNRGWIEAGKLREGDNVIRRVGPDRIVGRVPHEQNVPTRIEDRFSAGAVVSLVSVPFAAEQFHGDAGQGEVSVVSADGRLNSRVLTALGQPVQHSGLTLRPRTFGRSRICGFHQSRLRLRHPARGSVRSGSPSLALAGALAAGGDAVLLGGGTERHALDLEQPSHRVAADTEAFGKGEYRFPFEVEADSVRHTRRFDWKGHVFNLVTEDGWYVANGILTHNCGCGVEPLTSATDRVINNDLYKELGDSGAIDRQTAESSARRLESRAAANRARAEEVRNELASETDIDRRERLSLRAQDWDARAQAQETQAKADRATASGKRVAVRDHGELGPVLVDASHDFAAL